LRVPIEQSSSDHNTLRFSSFEVDLRAGELRKFGTRIKLQDQPFQILALLLENPGAVVTREQLRQRLWAADTFVDFDHSLNSAVKKLRQALNDDPDVPRFVETLPKRGYRFIAPLRNGVDTQSSGESHSIATNASAILPSPVGAEATHQAVPSLPVHHASVHHWKLWAAGAVGFMLALGLVAWFGLSRPAKVANTEPIRLVPLTTYSGKFSKGAFSPDGNEVAFAWEGEGEDEHRGVDIYIKQLGVEKPLQVTRNFGYNFFPIWSPDGRYLAFLHANHDESPGIFVIPALGGPPRKLHEFRPHEDCKLGLSWSPDGRYLIFPDQIPGQPCRVEQLTLDDLSVHPLSTPPVPSTGDWDAQYSPDGQSIAFIRNTKDVEDIYVMPAAGGGPTRVTSDNRLLSGIAWTPDSKEIIFSSNRGGASWGLWRVAVGGSSVPERLSVGSEHAYMPTVSLKGNRLAYASGSWNENIWRVPIGAGHRGGKAERFISSSMSEEGPQYSPDGKHIVFQSTRSGSFEIWRADADGTNLAQLTSFGGPLTGTPRWSPDGRWISFDSRPGAHPNVYIISPDGGPPRRLVNDTADEGVASWSGDGRWIYYASNRTGAWQVWKRPVDRGELTPGVATTQNKPSQGEPVQITRNGGFAAIEAPDGKTLYYTKFDQNGVWQVPVGGGEETKIISDEPFGDFWGYFAVGRDGLYYIGDTGTNGKHRPGFKFYGFATKKITTICDMEKGPYAGAPGLSVSPDGRYLIYVQLDEARENLMMAENFH
jgi:Tol biopolymer transport system component/DNA-binding winged helix-turn-helix (wHTH) protein